jgi:hypothetical protein
MFTTNHAEYLLQLEKKVLHNDILQNELSFDQKFPFQHKFILISPLDNDYTFIYDVNQSSKNQFKLTLYLFDSDTRIGLFRVDFSGQHKNPETIIDKVPDFLHPYAGMFFNYHQPHVHYYVEGYKTTLDWAIPITDSRFPIKKIENEKDILSVFYEFNKIINLITKFLINPIIL